MFETLKRMKGNDMLSDEMIETAAAREWISAQEADILKNM